MPLEERYLWTITGAPGVLATAARGALACAEPVYAAALAARNIGYDWGWLPRHRLARPTVGVGNLTVGGTGKTPVVRWLAEALRSRGHRPAVLTRGYKTADEPAMLDRMLNGADKPRVPVVADADRVAGASRALAEEPAVDCFLLDDGFQHRRVRRAFDLVLLDAAAPLGRGLAAGRVLPRGLLRERPWGLRRADAVVLTRCDRATGEQLAAAERLVRRWNADAPIYHARHAVAGYVDASGRPVAPDPAVPAFAACGLADPDEFFGRVSADFNVVGRRRFPDHHDYDAADVEQLRAADAAWVVVTEKDWAKLSRLVGPTESRPHFLRAEVEIQFAADGAERLLEMISSLINPAQAGV